MRDVEGGWLRRHMHAYRVRFSLPLYMLTGSPFLFGVSLVRCEMNDIMRMVSIKGYHKCYMDVDARACRSRL
jgi:hypothetical protein